MKRLCLAPPVCAAIGMLLLGSTLACKRKQDEPAATAKAPLPAGPPPPAITAPWRDNFDRAELGSDYLDTSGKAYRLDSGALNARGAHNRPLWLRRRLPRDVVIEFDVWSNSPEGDIKVEAFGDGRSYAVQASYTATGYVFIFGGWGNSKSILARQNEHGNKLAVDTSGRKVVPRQRYHFTIARKGTRIDWSIDGKLFLRYDDPSPLEGDDHGYFGFNNWRSDLWFDNLSIRPN